MDPHNNYMPSDDEAEENMIDMVSEAYDLGDDADEQGNEDEAGASQGDPQQNSDTVPTSADGSGNETKQTPETKLQTDQKGNVINQNGEVEVFRGAERRLFNKYRDTVERDLPTIQNENKVLKEKVQHFEQTMDVFGKFKDLDAESTQIGLDFAREWRENPQRALASVLHSAATLGINIKEVPGLDLTSSMKTMLDQALKPFQEDRDKVANEQKIREEATKETHEFFEKNQDAYENRDIMLDLLQKFPGLTLNDAHTAILRMAAQYGYDPMQSISAQKKARLASGQPEAKPDERQQPSMPVANGRPGASEVVQEKAPDKYADPQQSYRDVSRSVIADLKSKGFNFG